MGFGQKTDLATGRVLDLDKSYRNIIKPAVTAAGYECVRADEIQHSGVIDVPMYEMLFAADLVVADLSTANLNAIFELGVRHALRPRATIIMAESKFTIPVRRQSYRRSPLRTSRARYRLRRSHAHARRTDDSDQRAQGRGCCRQPGLHDAARSPEADTARYDEVAWPPPRFNRNPPRDSYAAKLQTAREAMDAGAFDFAKKNLQDIYKDQTTPGADGKPKAARPFVIQQLALATYKAGEAKAKTEGPSRRWRVTPKPRRCSGNSPPRRPPILRRSVCGAPSTSEGPKWRQDRRTSESRTLTRRSGPPSVASSSSGTITTERTSPIS